MRDSPGPSPARTAEQRARSLRRGFALGSAAVIFLAVLTLSPALTTASKELLGYSSFSGFVNTHLNPFRTRHALIQGELPVYDLKIPNADYRQILQVVDAARQRGMLTEDLKRWSNARFVYEGRTREVRIRIRGDFADHWQDHRRSWRIRFPKQDLLDGQREINLIVPADGKAINQAFANAVFRRLGCITLRDRYVVLRINGIPQGVYYQCEHFEAPLLAYSDKPETTIFRNPTGGHGTGSFREMVTEDNAAAWHALDTLLAYEREATPANFGAARAVTDEEDYARFLAGVALFSADHTSQVTDNHRLYYDLSAGVFLRIPWDLEPQRIPKLERFELADWHATFDVFARWPMSNFQIAMLQDDAFRLRRNRLLWDLVRDDSLLDLFDEIYREVRLAFWADVGGAGDEEARLDRFRQLVSHNLRLIRRALSANRAALTVRAQDAAVAELDFSVENASGIAVESMELTGGTPGTFAIYRDANGNGGWDENDALLAQTVHSSDGVSTIEGLAESMFPETRVAHDYPAYIHDPAGGGTPYRSKPLRTVLYSATRRHKYFLVRFDAPAGAAWPAVRPRARNAVSNQPVADEVFPVRFLDLQHGFSPSLRTRTIGAFLDANPQFSGDRAGAEVTVGPGTITLNGTTIVPAGVTMRIQPGTTLRLFPQASVVCFGPILAEGTPEAPIEIVAAADEPWGVVAAVRPGKPSVFRHVHVRGGNTLAGITVQGIYFTGAVAIHHGDAVVETCEFRENPAEDGLNVKHGRVVIRDSVFRDNGGDAMDLDWVSGEVSRCRFLHNAGDAVDLSGATVRVADNRMERSGDKGISVGERSRPEICDNVLVDNAIGVAVKDLSEAALDRCVFVGNKTSVAAYRKKPMFGGGKASLRNCFLMDTEKLLDMDSFSAVAFESCQTTADFGIAGLQAISEPEAEELRRQTRAGSNGAGDRAATNGTD